MWNEKKWINRILGRLYGLALSSHPWHWPWSFKVRFWTSLISRILTWNQSGVNCPFITIILTLLWPWWGVWMHRIVIGVTSDAGVPSTHLVFFFIHIYIYILCNCFINRFLTHFSLNFHIFAFCLRLLLSLVRFKYLLIIRKSVCEFRLSCYNFYCPYDILSRRFTYVDMFKNVLWNRI